MPTPFAGAAISDATAVPWYSPGPFTVWPFRNVVLGRPANSGCVGSTPLSTTITGTPGPGGVARSHPPSASHHSCDASGPAAPAATAPGAATASAASVTASGRRPTRSARVPSTLAAVARAYVGLGSNLGDREQTIRAAAHELGARDG